MLLSVPFRLLVVAVGVQARDPEAPEAKQARLGASHEAAAEWQKGRAGQIMVPLKIERLRVYAGRIESLRPLSLSFFSGKQQRLKTALSSWSFQKLGPQYRPSLISYIYTYIHIYKIVYTYTSICIHILKCTYKRSPNL